MKDNYSIYLYTTIFAIIGTIVYSLIVYLFYPRFISFGYIISFFVVVWAIYFLIAKSRLKNKNYY